MDSLGQEEEYIVKLLMVFFFLFLIWGPDVRSGHQGECRAATGGDGLGKSRPRYASSICVVLKAVYR